MVVLFDGNDPDALALAREQWRAMKQEGHAATYWQQDGTRPLGAKGLRPPDRDLGTVPSAP